MKAVLLALLLVACGSGRIYSFEQATKDQALCDTENRWIEQKEPGYWVAMCGDENGNPLHRAK